jgi:hypothetical protein
VIEYLHKFTELSRYAPYEVDNDEKKQDAFLCGLDPELRTLIGAGVYLDFNTMVNRVITTTKNKQDDTRDRKRKFEAKRAYPQEKTMKLQPPPSLDRRATTKSLIRLPLCHISHLLPLRRLMDPSSSSKQEVAK